MKIRKFLLGLLFTNASFLVNCQSTSVEDAPQKADAVKAAEVSKKDDTDSLKTARLEAEKDPLSDELAGNGSGASEIEKMGALPLPSSANAFELKRFMEKYQPIYQVHLELWEGWAALKEVFMTVREPSPKELLAIEEKFQENPERSHWIFCVGVSEMISEIKGTEAKILLHDREKSFIKNMKALVFLGQKNDMMFGGSRYAQFNKVAYKDISQRYFGRKLK